MDNLKVAFKGILTPTLPMLLSAGIWLLVYSVVPKWAITPIFVGSFVGAFLTMAYWLRRDYKAVKENTVELRKLLEATNGVSDGLTDLRQALPQPPQIPERRVH